MTCEDFKKHINAYIDNELGEEICETVKSHIKDCPGCRRAYEDMLHIHDQLQNLYTEKDLPQEFEAQLINSLPTYKSKTNLWEVIFMKKAFIPALAAVLLLCIFAIPFMGRGRLPIGSEKRADLAVLVKYNDITYMKAFREVITDERSIGEEFGEVKFEITEKNSNGRKVQNGDATVLPVGTKLYSLKGIDKKEALAVKHNGSWSLYRAQSTLTPQYSIYNEDMLSAEKIVVSTYDTKGASITKEITDRNTIKSLASLLGSAEAVSSQPSFRNNSTYDFYFVIKDSNGIGKITRRYMLTFQEVNFEGYINADKTYKLKSDFNKLISAPFGPAVSNYDESLGGKQQIYAVDLYSPKFIFRKLLKEQTAEKYHVTLLDEGSQIWQNGVKGADNLKGKYKLEVIMKDTKVQKKVIDELNQNLSKINEAVSLSFSQGNSKDTTVMYIGFDIKPEFQADEFGDSFLLLINPKQGK